MFVVFVYFCVANLFFVYYHPTLCSMPSLPFADQQQHQQQQQHPVQGEHDRRARQLQVCRLSISYALSVLLTFTHRSRMLQFICCIMVSFSFLSFLRRTHLLFGMYSYDWIHTLILLSSLNSSFVEL